MIDIPDPPRGSRVGVRPLDDGIQLSWRPRPHRAAFVWVMLEFAVAGAALFVAATLVGLAVFSTASLDLATVTFVVGGIAAVGVALALVIRHRSLATEYLCLRSDSIAHMPAQSPARIAEMFGSWDEGWRALCRISRLRAIFARRESLTASRSDVVDIRLLGRARFEHVEVKLKSGYVDMAKHIRHGDREWLAASSAAGLRAVARSTRPLQARPPRSLGIKFSAETADKP